MIRLKKLPVITISALTVIGALLLLPVIATGDDRSDINLNSTSKQIQKQPNVGDSNREKTRGQLLYENNCSVCHETSVHKRNPRKADSMAKIKYWVTRWSTELKLNWPDSDINAVTKYLNSRYYKLKE